MNGIQVVITAKNDAFGEVTFSDYQQNGDNYTVDVHTDAGSFCVEAIYTRNHYYFCIEGYELADSELPAQFISYHRRNSPVDC